MNDLGHGRERRSRGLDEGMPHPCSGLRNARACIRNSTRVKNIVLARIPDAEKGHRTKFLAAFESGERIPPAVMKFIPKEEGWEVLRSFLREYGKRVPELAEA